ncbi:MAG: hypothetical protein GXY14_11450, partial [Spirochaetes bacterium]|nr:hypothetical protein [Spirochaetota bacterium]
FLYIAEKLVEWYHPGIGSVAGATYPEQLEKISKIFLTSGKEIPYLIPGVGTQGGSISDVMAVLNRYPDKTIHRINSSSSLNYAYKTFTNMNYGDAAVWALSDMNLEIENIK